MIQAEHLTKRYGQHLAIDDLTFTIEKGEVLGFLGPNGAGKTTAMNIITGYLSATNGSVSVDGMDVLEHPKEVKKKIGYLPEQPPLYTDMKVMEYLKFVGAIKKVPKNEFNEGIDKILDLIQIADVSHRLINNLSKGYRQRVGLAQALIGNPELLILDEPTVGLDPKQIIEIRNLITSLRKEHTIVLSSHILPEVSAVCDRVLIINDGKIVASDTPDNLSKGLLGANRLTLRISGTKEAIEGALKDIPAIQDIEFGEGIEKDAEDLIVSIQKDMDARREIFNALSKANLPILLMRPVDVTLEDIFLTLTTKKKEAV